MARRHYSDRERAAARAKLEANGGNLTLTARETGISRYTLRAWAKDASEQPEHLKASAGSAEDTSWWPAFLESLMATCNVTESAKAARVGRVTAYDHRKRHPDFAKAWDEAKAIGADTLEDEAVRRARDGWDEPVFYKGEETGTVRKFSDTLLIFLLKGAKPDTYRERHEVTGKDGGPLDQIVRVYIPDNGRGGGGGDSGGGA